MLKQNLNDINPGKQEFKNAALVVIGLFVIPAMVSTAEWLWGIQ